MKLLEALIHSARFSVNPTFSLFGVSSKGEYTLLTTEKPIGILGSNPVDVTEYAQRIVDRFKAEAIKSEHAGLEVRTNGSTVKFNGT